MANVPPERGWGKLNQGQRYGILAVDLDRALARAGLNQAEQTLIQQLRERSWGTATRAKARGEAWPDAHPVRVNLTELARSYRPDAPANEARELRKAKAALTADGIIRDDGGELTINKNVDEWARLSPEARAWCREAQPRGPGQSPLVSRGNRPGGAGAIAPSQSGQSPLASRGNRPYPPIEERAAEDFEIPEEKTHTVCGIREGGKELDFLASFTPAERAEARREGHDFWPEDHADDGAGNGNGAGVVPRVAGVSQEAPATPGVGRVRGTRRKPGV